MTKYRPIRDITFPTKCQFCGEDVMFFKDTNGGSVFFNLDFSGLHRDTCTSPDNIYASSKNIHRSQQSIEIAEYSESFFDFDLIFLSSRKKDKNKNLYQIFSRRKNLFSSLLIFYQNSKKILEYMKFDSYSIYIKIEKLYSSSDLKDRSKFIHLSNSLGWIIEFSFFEDEKIVNHRKAQENLQKIYHEMLSIMKIAKIVNVSFLAKKLNLDSQTLIKIINTLKNASKLVINGDNVVYSESTLNNPELSIDWTKYFGLTIPKIPSKMNYFFFKDRNFHFLFNENKKIVEWAKLVPWSEESITQWLKYAQLIPRKSVKNSSFSSLGPKYALFFLAWEYGNENPIDIKKPLIINDETITSSKEFRGYLRLKTQIIQFLQNDQSKLHFSGKTIFDALLLISYLYLLGGISKEEFKAVALNILHEGSRSRDEGLYFHIENMLFHTICLIEKEITNDFNLLRQNINDFLGYIGLRPESENEIIQKLNNWFLQLDPYTEIREIRNSVKKDPSLINSHQWEFLNTYGFNYLSNTFSILWPSAIKSLYLKSKMNIESSFVDKMQYSVDNANEQLGVISSAHQIVDECGIPYFNSLNPFDSVLKKIEINPTDILDIPARFSYIKDPILNSRQKLRSILQNTADEYCQLIFLGGYQIGKSCILIKTQSSSILVDFGRDPTSGLTPYWCPELEDIDAVFISHLHADHCGGLFDLRNIYKYDGPIFLHELNELFFQEIMQDNLKHQVRDRFSNASRIEFSDFLNSEVNSLENQCIFSPYDQWITISNQIELKLLNAGHIPGSASCLIRINHEKIIYFTNDFNINKTSLPLKFSYPVEAPDFIIMEGTYVSKSFKDSNYNPAQSLIDNITNQENFTLIPAFSLGRSQEVLKILYDAKLDKLKKIGILGLASKVSKKFHDLWFSDSDIKYIDRFDINHIIDDFDVLIASSGFLNGGPSLEIFNYLVQNNTPFNIILTGYCSIGSISRKLSQDSAIPYCRFSAHTDHLGLEHFISKFPNIPIYLTHSPLPRNEIKKIFPTVNVPNILDRIRLF